MRILLINGSLRGEASSSLKLARAFVQGMVLENGEENTAVTEISLKEKKIDHCHGCFCSWKNSKGKCVIHDDMDEIRSLIMESDVIIECFPLYFFGLPSKLKAFMDRMICFVSESIATTEGSLRTTPLPLTYTKIEAVPKSIPISVPCIIMLLSNHYHHIIIKNHLTLYSKRLEKKRLEIN